VTDEHYSKFLIVGFVFSIVIICLGCLAAVSAYINTKKQSEYVRETLEIVVDRGELMEQTAVLAASTHRNVLSNKRSISNFVAMSERIERQVADELDAILGLEIEVEKIIKSPVFNSVPPVMNLSVTNFYPLGRCLPKISLPQ